MFFGILKHMAFNASKILDHDPKIKDFKSTKLLKLLILAAFNDNTTLFDCLKKINKYVTILVTIYVFSGERLHCHVYLLKVVNLHQLNELHMKDMGHMPL